MTDTVEVINEKADMINHPPHYNMGKIEPITVIEDWDLGYHLGNAVKYLARYKYKGTPIEDLKKAVWFINRKISIVEKFQKKL